MFQQVTYHSPLEDESSKTVSEGKPETETSTGVGMSYLDSMSANTAAPDWSKAKAPKTPDSPPPSASSPSNLSANSDSSAKVTPASETTSSSTSISYLESMTGASTSAPDWSKAKAPPPPESNPVSPTGAVPSNPVSLPKVDSVSRDEDDFNCHRYELS